MCMIVLTRDKGIVQIHTHTHAHAQSVSLFLNTEAELGTRIIPQLISCLLHPIKPRLGCFKLQLKFSGLFCLLFFAQLALSCLFSYDNARVFTSEKHVYVQHFPIHRAEKESHVSSNDATALFLNKYNHVSYKEGGKVLGNLRSKREKNDSTMA